ncbi:hypothetical protein MNBD_ACTINO02-310, partial [hydrothermal vent metagenome]
MNALDKELRGSTRVVQFAGRLAGFDPGSGRRCWTRRYPYGQLELFCHDLS